MAIEAEESGPQIRFAVRGIAGPFPLEKKDQ